jgi:hypothetical protein
VVPWPESRHRVKRAPSLAWSRRASRFGRLPETAAGYCVARRPRARLRDLLRDRKESAPVVAGRFAQGNQGEPLIIADISARLLDTRGYPH